MIQEEKYSVEVVNPPPGWDDVTVAIRHRNVGVDQVGHAAVSLLKLALSCWRNGVIGEQPMVTIRRSSPLYPKQLELPIKKAEIKMEEDLF